MSVLELYFQDRHLELDMEREEGGLKLVTILRHQETISFTFQFYTLLDICVLCWAPLILFQLITKQSFIFQTNIYIGKSSIHYRSNLSLINSHFL